MYGVGRVLEGVGAEAPAPTREECEGHDREAKGSALQMARHCHFEHLHEIVEGRLVIGSVDTHSLRV